MFIFYCDFSDVDYAEVMRELEARAAKDAARANLADEKLNHLQTVTETRIAQLEAQVCITVNKACMFWPFTETHKCIRAVH